MMISTTFPHRCGAFALAVTFTSCTTSAATAEAPIECPPALSEKSISVTSPNSSWRPYVPYAMKLTGAGFMAGAPETLTELKPSFIKESKLRTVAQWNFVGTYPDGKWLSCSYGGGTITLSKTIDVDTKSCEVTYALSLIHI